MELSKLLIHSSFKGAEISFQEGNERITEGIE
jgi:hypothetical protein